MELENAQYERFCQEYLKDLNVRQAAIRAGYSKKTATSGIQFFTNPEVQARIAELKAERMQRVQVEQDDVLREWLKIAKANIQDYLNDDLSVKDLSKIDRHKADAIASIKKVVTPTQHGDREVIEFKLHDKARALENIGKHIDFYREDNNREVRVIMDELDKNL